MKNIVAAIDFSERSEAVLRIASDHARAFEAHLWLVHVAAPEPGFVGYDGGPQSVRDNVAFGLAGAMMKRSLYIA